ncbi:uncharacterized protein [Nicotiana sylvestris]|uniref:uncharacterized protein n=1 Tax=Nicotiana sylvestris TaxID=4096 RepID=UPI00388CE07B
MQKPISSSTEVSTSYQFNGELAEQTVALRGGSSSILRTVQDFLVSNNVRDVRDSSWSTLGTCAEQNDITMHNTANRAVREAKDCHFERNIIVREEDLLLEAKLNTEQRKAYDKILNTIFSNQPGVFFIDEPGGTGKTFLYHALLAVVRSKDFVALAIATSGVAASILPGGRTAHSRFKFPIEIDEQYSCNISKQSSLAAIIRDAKLIVWDEVSMAKRKLIEAFDVLLKDLMDTKAPFRGKVVVFGGDFRQTLQVVRNGKKEDFIQESLLYFKIWNQFEKMRLSENMQAKTDHAFCEYLLRIGNGEEKNR